MKAGNKPRRRDGRDQRSRREKSSRPISQFRRDQEPAGARRGHGDRGPLADEAPKRAERLWIYGRHAGLAAIANPRRRVKRILAADGALDWLEEARLSPERRALVRTAPAAKLDRALHPGAVHQGLAVEVEELVRARLKEACRPEARRPVLVLDQITDPHNIGAIFRSAAAFGAKAVIVQERRTPPLAGALAKAAAGAVEIVPSVPVVNVARALEGLKTLGYLCVGLAGNADGELGDLPRDRPIALVLGAEGAGLRRLVAETCDRLVRIRVDRRMESLNVSNAAAVALYEATR